MISHSDRGVYISFIGIDGIGKTTLCNAFRDQLQKSGTPVKVVSWRKIIESQDTNVLKKDLQYLWLGTFRMLFSGATPVGGSPLPDTYTEWAKNNWEATLNKEATNRPYPGGPLSSTLLEAAGNILLTTEYIRSLVEEGYVVLQETFPYKHLLKEILIAQELSESEEFNTLCNCLREFSKALFSTKIMQPDVGIYLEGDVSSAYQWRTQQSGTVGILEDYGVSGIRGADSFFTLQTRCASDFHERAIEWGWTTHHIDDQGVESNIQRGLTLLDQKMKHFQL